MDSFVVVLFQIVFPGMFYGSYTFPCQSLLLSSTVLSANIFTACCEPFWCEYFFHQVKGYAIINGKELGGVDDLKGTSEDSKGSSEIVHAAVCQLRKLCNNIKEGTVTGKEVENYRQQANKLQALCEAVNIGSTQLVPRFTEISKAMQDCLEKLKVVKEYRSKLFVVVDYCNDISKGMLRLL